MAAGLAERRTLFDECCKRAIHRAIDRVSRAHADRIVGIDAQGLLGRPFDPARDAPSQELARRCAGRARVYWAGGAGHRRGWMEEA